jgi:hypothetical protein
MSAPAHPTNRFERTPPGLVALWLTALGVLALAALLLSLDRASGSLGFSATLHGWLLTIGAVLLSPVPFFTLDRLQAQRRVWLGRLAPRGVWLALLADHRRDLLASWALVALPLMAWRGIGRPAGEAWAQTALAAGSTATLLAGVLGAALITAAGLSTILATRWAAFGALGMTALLAEGAGVAASTPGHGDEAALASAFMVLGGALPLLALRHIEAGLAVWHITPEGAPLSWWARRAALGARLSERWRLVDRPATKGSLLTVMLTQLPNNLATSNADARFLQAWGSTVTVGHGLRLACMVLVAHFSLRCIDMHWRVHLLPGGSGRRWLGLRIIGSTVMTVLVTLVLLLALTWLGFSLFLPAAITPGWSALPALIAAYTPPLLADLCLAVSLAAWLRARHRPAGQLAWTWAVLVVSALLIVAVLSRVWAWPALWTRGYVHHAIEFTLAAGFAMLANRAWQAVDLGELMRSRGDGRDKP